MKKKRTNSFHDKFSVPNRLWNWNLDGSLNDIIYREIWNQGQGSVIFETYYGFNPTKVKKIPVIMKNLLFSSQDQNRKIKHQSFRKTKMSR